MLSKTKTIFITGSTDGIGKLAAKKLAAEGHQVILHGRNVQKLELTISEIKEQTSNDKITGFTCDLSDLKSIDKLISELLQSFSKLDVLINNAGVLKSDVQTNQDGLDLRFAVNYFAPYKLTKGLTPLLKNSESPRIINLSSAAQGSVSMDALEGNMLISEKATYAQSKLALTMWSFSFAKINPEITTIAVNPGSLLNTNMVREAYGQYWSSADKGANILYDLAMLKEHENKNGKYFDNDSGRYADAHGDAYDGVKISELITATERILSK